MKVANISYLSSNLKEISLFCTNSNFSKSVFTREQNQQMRDCNDEL